MAPEIAIETSNVMTSGLGWKRDEKIERSFKVRFTPSIN